MNAVKKNLKGFTLIELLIVIAILGILIVALLVAINPLEAQKKARDAKRLADLSTLNTILNQFMSDTGVAADIGPSLSSAAGAVYTGVKCGTGTWLGTNVNTCVYAPTVPVDPLNNKANVAFQGVTTLAAYSVFLSSSGTYEVNVYVESAANVGKASGDGGDNANKVEVGTSLVLMN
jgi:prepilin-type N-terminal cleavage/methylation domain-containing protein